MIVMTPYLMASIMDDLTESITAGNFVGCLRGLNVGLYTNPIPLNTVSSLSDFVQPTYTGYAPQGPLAWGTAYHTPDGGMAMSGQLLQFFASSSNIGTPATCLGYFVYNPAVSGHPVMFAEAFDEPQTISSAYSVINVSPTFAFTNDTSEGGHVWS